MLPAGVTPRRVTGGGPFRFFPSCFPLRWEWKGEVEVAGEERHRRPGNRWWSGPQVQLPGWLWPQLSVTFHVCVCVCTFFACLIFVLAALSHAFVLRISSVMTHEKHTFFCRVVFNFSFFFVFQTRRCHSLVSYFTQNLAGNDRLVTPVHLCPPVSLCSPVSLSSFCALLGVFLCLGSIYWPYTPMTCTLFVFLERGPALISFNAAQKNVNIDVCAT